MSDESSDMIIRIAQDEDAESMLVLSFDHMKTPSDGAALVLERSGVVIGCGCVSSRGPATEPQTPMVEATFARAATRDERFAFIEALIDQAEALGVLRLLATCDPMSADETQLFEALGFRPAERGPYFVMGGSVVEYVSGYQDASGSTLDMVIDIE